MSDLLNKKIIFSTKTESGRKKYTVQQLRSDVRAKIKEANKILIDLNESKKSEYMKSIAADIQMDLGLGSIRTEGSFSQMQVKFMTSKQLTTAYNALTKFIEADRESTNYVKKLANRKEEMRKKTEKTLGKEITPEAYNKLLKFWEGYHDKFEQYGYSQNQSGVEGSLVDYANKTADSNESIAEAIEGGEETLRAIGVTPTPNKVLKYLSNKAAVNDLAGYFMNQGDDIKTAYDKAIKRLTKQ